MQRHIPCSQHLLMRTPISGPLEINYNNENVPIEADTDISPPFLHREWRHRGAT